MYALTWEGSMNETVVRVQHPTPTLEETSQATHGAKVFLKLDLQWGYHQIELPPDSPALTTFSTHTGLEWNNLWFVLHFGAVSIHHPGNLTGHCRRSEHFQQIIFGKDQQSHDRSLEETFKWLKEHGPTVNTEKCLFSSLNWFSLVSKSQPLVFLLMIKK